LDFLNVLLQNRGREKVMSLYYNLLVLPNDFGK